MARHIVISPLGNLPVGHRVVELCEHKGIGHPDTLMDGVCEAASRALSRAYLAACGRILHHNLDKGLLIAGSSHPRFGGGEVLEPMRLVICGRATDAGADLKVNEIVAGGRTTTSRANCAATLGISRSLPKSTTVLPTSRRCSGGAR